MFLRYFWPLFKKLFLLWRLRAMLYLHPVLTFSENSLISLGLKSHDVWQLVRNLLYSVFIPVIKYRFTCSKSKLFWNAAK